MKLQEETTCIATPGFAGFVPSMKYQFGLTYGNATRHILHTDPSLKKGIIQQEFARRQRAYKAGMPATSAQDSAQSSESKEDADAYVWKGRNKYATGDDRFSFPPVPGYTGYIPRSQEHFGKPYVETTNASLASFQRMLKSKNQLPPRVLAIQQHQAKKKSVAESQASATDASLSTSNPSSNTKLASTFTESSASQPPKTSTAASFPIDEVSPYKLPSDHPQKTFISGYTGFVPRLQNHFGQPYSHSVRSAIEEFTHQPPVRNPYIDTEKRNRSIKIKNKDIVKTDPIPGFTGFIPGSRTCYSMTFGKTANVAYDQFNHRDEKGRVMTTSATILPPKDLATTLPIPGYRGHIPSFAFSAERSYGISSKECIDNFVKIREIEKNERV